jgi:hypothetical protein
MLWAVLDLRRFLVDSTTPFLSRASLQRLRSLLMLRFSPEGAARLHCEMAIATRGLREACGEGDCVSCASMHAKTSFLASSPFDRDSLGLIGALLVTETVAEGSPRESARSDSSIDSNVKPSQNAIVSSHVPEASADSRATATAPDEPTDAVITAENWADACEVTKTVVRRNAPTLTHAEAAARRRLRAAMIHELYLHVVTLDRLDSFKAAGEYNTAVAPARGSAYRRQ